jgi:hypothetical protein
MTCKQIILETLKEHVLSQVSNDETLIRRVARSVVDDLDYADIASLLDISNADLAGEIDSFEVLTEIVDNIDMNDLREAIVERCDMDDLASKVASMLPTTFLDDIAIQAAEEIIAEFGESTSVT